MQNEAIQKFHKYLEYLLETYTNLAELLQNKLGAVQTDDLGRLSDIMKEEQAYVLVSRGFDDQVQAHRKALGFTGATLRENIEELPAEWQDRFHPLFLSLRGKLEEVQALNESCQSNVQLKLDLIDKQLNPAESNPAPQFAEGKQAPREQKSSLFDKTI